MGFEVAYKGGRNQNAYRRDYRVRARRQQLQPSGWWWRGARVCGEVVEVVVRASSKYFVGAESTTETSVRVNTCLTNV